jgi:hypothetical protein
MSEDIDLKIVSDDPPTRPALRHLREVITDSLHAAGFAFDPDNPAHRESGNASRYTLYRLPYTPVSEGSGSLRPEIQIETAVWPLRIAPVELPVVSFVSEALKRPFEVDAMPCVSLVETAAEKFVALTRRAGAEFAAAGGPRDVTLVRHIYDLHAIREHYNLVEAAELARAIMLTDVEAYGHQFPAYREDPIRETIRAVELLAGDPGFTRRYADFLRDMVYDGQIPFEVALPTITAFAKLL